MPCLRGTVVVLLRRYLSLFTWCLAPRTHGRVGRQPAQQRKQGKEDAISDKRKTKDQDQSSRALTDEASSQTVGGERAWALLSQLRRYLAMTTEENLRVATYASESHVQWLPHCLVAQRLHRRVTPGQAEHPLRQLRRFSWTLIAPRWTIPAKNAPSTSGNGIRNGFSQCLILFLPFKVKIMIIAFLASCSDCSGPHSHKRPRTISEQSP